MRKFHVKRRFVRRGPKRLPTATWINRFGGVTFDGILTTNLVQSIVLADSQDVGSDLEQNEQVTMSLRRIVGRFIIQPSLGGDDLANIDDTFLAEGIDWLNYFWFAFAVIPADDAVSVTSPVMRAQQGTLTVGGAPVGPEDAAFWTFFRPIHFDLYTYRGRWTQQMNDIAGETYAPVAFPGAGGDATFPRRTRTRGDGKLVQVGDTNPLQNWGFDLNVRRRWTKRDRLVMMTGYTAAPPWWTDPSQLPDYNVSGWWRTYLRHDE